MHPYVVSGNHRVRVFGLGFGRQDSQASFPCDGRTCTVTAVPTGVYIYSKKYANLDTALTLEQSLTCSNSSHVIYGHSVNK